LEKDEKRNFWNTIQIPKASQAEINLFTIMKTVFVFCLFLIQQKEVVS